MGVVPIRVTHPSSPTSSPFPPHSTSESPLPPSARGQPIQSCVSLASAGWRGMPGFPGGRGVHGEVLDPEFLSHPRFWGEDQKFGVPLFLSSAPINLPSKPTVTS